MAAFRNYKKYKKVRNKVSNSIKADHRNITRRIMLFKDNLDRFYMKNTQKVKVDVA